QSVGDSKRPLFYLMIATVVNIVLDLLFVGVFKWGVWSAAFATVISQFISALLCLRTLLTTTEEYRVDIKKICFDMFMLKQIIQNGLPTGLNNSIIAIANVVVQSNINAFGKMAVAGCGAYSKIEGFGFLPINCFTMALTTFISQNLGAKQFERAKKGARFGILCSVILAETIGIIIYLFAPQLIGIFNSDPAIVEYGVIQARIVTLFYCLLAYSHCLASIFRGAGKSTIPMLVMLASWCIIRVTYITIIVQFIPVINVIFWAYPLTWSISTVVFTIFYFKSNWMKAFQ
ncbi:MAG: polysaccharide biosynthesis C-terminal domain-containing protein, partial [Lachnospiraceae bacterium]|nr:polysaccharide biosynthesis C-terminal domain-containing protein [Lachnospiraceae bacterium]